MSFKRKPKDFICITNGRSLFNSAAWMKLSGTAIKMYCIFLTKKAMAPMKDSKRNKKWVIVNNGEITFSLSEAMKALGKSRATVLKARDDLVQYGFIDIDHPGGCYDGDHAKYAISERWKKYGTSDFKEIVRPKDTRNIGFRKFPQNRYNQNFDSKKSTAAV